MKQQLRLIKEGFTTVVIVDFIDGKREKFPHVRDLKVRPDAYCFEWWDEESKLTFQVELQKHAVKTFTFSSANPSQSTEDRGPREPR